MKKTIAALLHENLPDTNCFLFPDAIMTALEEDTERVKAKFEATLGQEQAASFTSYVRHNDEWTKLREELAFINGFRVAARLFAEVYAEER